MIFVVSKHLWPIAAKYKTANTSMSTLELIDSDAAFMRHGIWLWLANGPFGDQDAAEVNPTRSEASLA